MNLFANHTTEAEWRVCLPVDVQLDAAERARLAEAIRPQLLRHMASDPAIKRISLKTPVGPATLERTSEGSTPASRVKLVFAADVPPAPKPGHPGYRQVSLPDSGLLDLSKRLVGLDAPRHDIVLRLLCRQHGTLEAWAIRTGSPVAPPLKRHLSEHAAVFALVGDPGVGKSALAQVAADQACRQAGVTGTLLYVGTEARGNGLVGDLSAKLSAAFAALNAAPGSLKVLLLDEADAVAVRRSESQSHHEDRAGTAAIIQAIDRMSSVPGSALFLTSNLENQLDAAIRRRATIYRLERPDSQARRLLLRRWLPHFGALDLRLACAASRGMTPADLENALVSVLLAAVKDDRPASARQVIAALRSGERTGRV